MDEKLNKSKMMVHKFFLNPNLIHEFRLNFLVPTKFQKENLGKKKQKSRENYQKKNCPL